MAGHGETRKILTTYIFVGKESPCGDVIGHSEPVKCSKGAIFCGENPCGDAVGRGELVWSTTLSGSKTAHWLFPNSIVFGYKAAY